MDLFDSPQLAEKDVVAPLESIRKRVKDIHQNENKRKKKKGKEQEHADVDDDELDDDDDEQDGDPATSLRDAIERQQNKLNRAPNSRPTPHPVRMTKEELKAAKEAEKEQQKAAKKAQREQQKAAKKADKEATKKRKAETEGSTAPKRRKASKQTTQEFGVEQDETIATSTIAPLQQSSASMHTSMLAGFPRAMNYASTPTLSSQNVYRNTTVANSPPQHHGPGVMGFHNQRQMRTGVTQHGMTEHQRDVPYAAYNSRAIQGMEPSESQLQLSRPSNSPRMFPHPTTRTSQPQHSSRSSVPTEPHMVHTATGYRHTGPGARAFTNAGYSVSQPRQYNFMNPDSQQGLYDGPASEPSIRAAYNPPQAPAQPYGDHATPPLFASDYPTPDSQDVQQNAPEHYALLGQASSHFSNPATPVDGSIEFIDPSVLNCISDDETFNRYHV